jgi:AraC-like DNA-binding protein
MIFTLEEARPADSPFIEKIWRVENEKRGEFTSVAAAHSEIVIAKFGGETIVTVRGPETKASPALIPEDSEFFGIVFKLGTFMPNLLPKNLMDRRDVYLPTARGDSFLLDSSQWEMPTFENADTFVARLIRQGLLIHEPTVEAALEGQPLDLSIRTLQYRFLQATGLTQNTIRQIERARRAMTLLQQGTPILDTVFETGYFDQPHMTRALKQYVGQTPAQITRLYELA